MDDIGTEPKKHAKRPYYKGPKANTLTRAASMLGVDVATLKAAKDRGADGFDGYGRVHIEVLRAWMASHPLSDVASEKIETELSLKLRKLRVECMEKEHRLEVKKGIYIPAAEAREIWTRTLSAVRTSMLQLETLAPQLAGLPTHEVAKRIREHVREALDQAANMRF